MVNRHITDSVLIVMRQPIQETLALVIAHGQELALRRKVERPNIIQGSLGGGPVAKDGAGRNMHQLQCVSFPPRRHDQYLSVSIKANQVGRRVQVHDALELLATTKAIATAFG